MLKKGIPYAEALDRLNLAFKPKAGDIITHDALKAVIQADETRYRGVLAAWRKELRKRGLRTTGMGAARGIGVLFLTGQQDVANLDRRMFGLGRAATRVANETTEVDTSGFTEDELAQHALRKRLASETASHIKRANKILHEPPQITADNVRVLKS